MLKFIKKYYIFILLGILVVECYFSMGYSIATNFKGLLNDVNSSAIERDISDLISIMYFEAIILAVYYFAVFTPLAKARSGENENELKKKYLKTTIIILLIGDLISPALTVALCFFGLFFAAAYASNVSSSGTGFNKVVYDLPTDFFQSYGINNVSKFKRDLAFKYCDVMFATNEADFAELEKLCTTSKIAIIKGAINSQKRRNATRIIDNINIYDAKIYKYEIVNNKLLLHMNIYVSYIDYMKENNRVVYGSERTPSNYIIDLIFEKELDENRITLKYCEECGTEVKDNTKKYCDNCGASLRREKPEWLLKENIVLSKY